MASKFREIAFTSDVLAAQRAAYGAAQVPPAGGGEDRLGPDEAEFIASRDSFYLATVNQDGWPYVQHRGGAPGFLRVLDPATLAFADFRGNRQLVSTGNVARNDRVALFLMDYPGRRRLKILGHATRIEAAAEPELAKALAGDALVPRVERIFAIRVAGFDWNCPSYITPRYTESEVRAVIAPLEARIAQLEAQLASATAPR
jgi:predicted pyridoxine 5'-phosphate oxidase superfamily flavin-nucleotide-binding protein